MEQLFLEFTVQKAFQGDTNGFPIFEPWASEYVSAIPDGRYGVAVWAHYYIAGAVYDGIIEGIDKIVLERMEEDVLGYEVGDHEIYAEAVSFYANTSGKDGHPEVIEIIMRIDNTDTMAFQAQLEAQRRTEPLADL